MYMRCAYYAAIKCGFPKSQKKIHFRVQKWDLRLKITCGLSCQLWLYSLQISINWRFTNVDARIKI
jgi:hypothetical protein